MCKLTHTHTHDILNNNYVVSYIYIYMYTEWYTVDFAKTTSMQYMPGVGRNPFFLFALKSWYPPSFSGAMGKNSHGGRKKKTLFFLHILGRLSRWCWFSLSAQCLGNSQAISQQNLQVVFTNFILDSAISITWKKTSVSFITRNNRKQLKQHLQQKDPPKNNPQKNKTNLSTERNCPTLPIQRFLWKKVGVS